MTTPNNQDDELDRAIIDYTADLMKGLEQFHFTKQEQARIVLKAKAAILAWHNKHLQEVERAYGGCHNCYGKGYSTVKYQITGYCTDGDIGGFEGPIKVDKPVEIKYCDCGRGRQLEQLSKSKEKV